jgi:hypothetical protein
LALLLVASTLPLGVGNPEHLASVHPSVALDYQRVVLGLTSSVALFGLGLWLIRTAPFLEPER